MKIYLNQTVFDAGLKRIRWLFDEFENIVVNFSGGKDSTVVLNMTLRVAEEKGRLPVKVLFIDQEAEWNTVIEYIRTVMSDPRVIPQWLQIPIKIFNATSTIEPWLMCWEPGKENEWLRQKEEISIKENVYGTDRFQGLFEAVFRHDYPKSKAVHIAGVRCSESPARMKGLTSYETYNGATWGSAEDKKLGHYTMYPLYDWGDSDIWKAIHDNKWEYCRVYDFMFQHGVAMRNMRVSNLHHETAVHSLFYLQEVEGDTWNRLVERLAGVNSAGHLQKSMFVPKDLPFMFETWREYRDYLIEHLIEDKKQQAVYHKQFAQADDRYEDEVTLESLCKLQISAVLVNDYHGTKMSSFVASHGSFAKGAGSKGGLMIGNVKEQYDAGRKKIA